MVPDDGDPSPAKPRGPVSRAVSLAEDAFAATIAPVNPPSPAELARGTAKPEPAADAASDPATIARRPKPTELEADATLAAPLVADPARVTQGGATLVELPPLPIVSDTLYKADHEIARGGMGRIVAAEDQRLGRPVALKELLEPAGDSLGRFQREALITARLQHPGIVPVYEAGRWPSGEPFFAMKLVSGRPLDVVINEARTLAARLALLPRIAAAADAIAYAHSQRVVHRDLKPGNILIGDFGETVVIDWGLAKDLDERESPISKTRLEKAKHSKPTIATSTASSTLTVAGAVMGTPAYMAPEQARGEPVDQRADVFALGAMLYHLLAGVPPYNARTATDVIAAAALAKVVPLVERERGAPRDLVAIVVRAMAPEPANRYPDAGELADELRRFLTGQLVSAHRYTTPQRIARFVRKHRAAVTIATVAVVTIAVGSTLAIRQIVDQRDTARTERRIADIRREAAEQLIDRMLSDVKERLIQIGRLDLLANLGGQIRDYYGILGRIPGGMPSDDVDRMATAVELVGRAERDSGQTDRALETWSTARAQVASVVGSDTGAATLGKRAMIARLDYQIGTIHQARGKAALAIASYTQAKGEFAALLAQAPTNREILRHSADNHDRLGDLLRNDGLTDRAFEEYSEAKSQREHASSLATTKQFDEVLALSTSHLKLASVYQARGDTTTAIAEERAALRLRETLLETQPDNVEVQERVLEVQGLLADLQRSAGDDASAIETYQQAVPVIDAMIRRDPANTTWKRQRANLFADLGFALIESGDFTGGVAQLGVAIEGETDLVGRDPKNTNWQNDLSRSYTRTGDGQLHLGKLDDGIASYERALEIRRKLSAGDPKSAPYRRSLAWSYHKLGSSYVLKNDLVRGQASHEQALGLRQQLVADAPTQTGFRNELASTEVVFGKLLAARDAKRGNELITAGIARARALVAADAISNEYKETLVTGLLARADAARLANDAAARRAALTEALAIATAAAARAPQNAHWPGFVAEIHAGLADLDPKAAAAEWKAARDQLEPLAKAGRLSALRKPLLDRARTGR